MVSATRAIWHLKSSLVAASVTACFILVAPCFDDLIFLWLLSLTISLAAQYVHGHLLVDVSLPANCCVT